MDPKRKPEHTRMVCYLSLCSNSEADISSMIACRYFNDEISATIFANSLRRLCCPSVVDLKTYDEMISKISQH